MKQDGTYKKLVEELRRNEPALSGEEWIADSVIQEIRQIRSATDPSWYIRYLFGWAQIGWVRTAMSGTAMLLVAVFLIQFISLNRKVGRLEKKLLPSTYKYYESPYQDSRGLIEYLPPGIGLDTDSIKISRRDLIELLNSYRRMQIRYNELKLQPDYLRKLPGQELPGREPAQAVKSKNL